MYFYLSSGKHLTSAFYGQQILLHSFLKINLFLAVLGLCCCTRAFPAFGGRGWSLAAAQGLLTEVAPLAAELRFCGAQALLVVATGLSSVGSVVVHINLRTVGSSQTGD